MDIKKIRETEKSRRLDALITEIYGIKNAKHTPGIINDLEMALKDLEKYRFYLGRNGQDVILVPDNNPQKVMVSFDNDSDTVKKEAAFDGYNAYAVLSIYIGIGPSEPASPAFMRLKYPQLVVNGIDSDADIDADEIYFDDIADRLLRILKYQFCRLIAETEDPFTAVVSF